MYIFHFQQSSSCHHVVSWDHVVVHSLLTLSNGIVFAVRPGSGEICCCDKSVINCVKLCDSLICRHYV